MLRVLASEALWGLVSDFGNHLRAADPESVDPPPTETAAKGDDNSPDHTAKPADAVVPKPRPARPYVGTVDLTRAFAEHIRFKVRSEELRVKMAAVEAEHSAERSKASVETQKAEFAQMEANLYRETFADVQFAVTAQAEARGMRLVLRVDPQTVTDDPLTIVKAINQFILHQEGIDLTDAVIATVNGKPMKADVVALPMPLVDEAPPSAFPVATLDLGRVFAEDLMFKQHTAKKMPRSAGVQPTFKARSTTESSNSHWTKPRITTESF